MKDEEMLGLVALVGMTLLSIVAFRLWGWIGVMGLWGACLVWRAR